MSKQPFAFPPPPPPPPRRANASSGNDGQASYLNQDTYRGGRGGWKGRGSRDEYAPRGDRGSGGGYTQNGHSYGPRTFFQQDKAGGQVGGYQRGYSRGGQAGFQPSPQSSAFRSDASQSLNPPQKRQYGNAFPTDTMSRNHPQAAPAVPSFNAGIASLMNNNSPPSTIEPKPSASKPRRQNQLGLTPSLNDGKSDSEDGDEEAKLAPKVSTTGYQFEYRGGTSTLKSASEIAAWIAERKKRFPTQARADVAKKEAEEKRLEWEKGKKAEQEAAKVKREEREMNERDKREPRQKLQDANRTASKSVQEPFAGDVAAKALLKAERLRKKAEKAQKQLAKAEKALRKAQSQRNTTVGDSRERHLTAIKPETADDKDSAILEAEEETVSPNNAVKVNDQSSNGPDTHPLPAQPNPLRSVIPDHKDIPAIDLESKILTSDATLIRNSSYLSDCLSDSDADSTSSSGSSDSSNSDSDDDSAPEESTFKLQAPIRVPPPKRTALATPRPPNICRSILTTGKCKFGARCRYSHDLSAKQESSRNRQKPATPHERPRRKSLFEVMVEKEHEQEREQMLRAIIALGQHGILAGDDASTVI